MKTLTEFASPNLKNAIKTQQELVAAGKTPEELPQALGEALKLEGDKLNFIMAAVELVGNKTNDLKRVVVFTLNEGEKAPHGAVQKGEQYYLSEYYPSMQAKGGRGAHDERGRGGKGDRKKGRGGKGGRRGERGEGRGERRGEGRGEKSGEARFGGAEASAHPAGETAGQPGEGGRGRRRRPRRGGARPGQGQGAQAGAPGASPNPAGPQATGPRPPLPKPRFATAEKPAAPAAPTESETK